MSDLLTGDLTVVGRIMPASNHTLLAELPDGTRVVYKPVMGEAPLWDFPDGTLAAREHCAWLVSEALGWGIVPETVLREGPMGRGMVQRWIDLPEDDEHESVAVVPLGATPPGWLEVLEAVDGADQPVVLIHEDSPALRRMAVFDVVVNNTDRKGGHVLALPDGRRLGVDHGVCFHVDDKLRTVLWGWAGAPLLSDEIAALQGLLTDDALTEALEDQLAMDEVAAMHRRVERLLAEGCLPDPGAGWPSIPWPPF